MNNQLSLVFCQSGDEKHIQVVMQTLRVYFLVPDIKRLIQFSVDLSLDQRHVPEAVRLFFKGSQKPPTNVFSPGHMTPRDIRHSNTTPVKHKAFIMPHQASAQPNRGANLATAIKTAKLTQDEERQQSEALRKK